LRFRAGRAAARRADAPLRGDALARRKARPRLLSAPAKDRPTAAVATLGGDTGGAAAGGDSGTAVPWGVAARAPAGAGSSGRWWPRPGARAWRPAAARGAWAWPPGAAPESAQPRRGRQRGVRRRAVRGPRSVVGLRGEL